MAREKQERPQSPSPGEPAAGAAPPPPEPPPPPVTEPDRWALLGGAGFITWRPGDYIQSAEGQPVQLTIEGLRHLLRTVLPGVSLPVAVDLADPRLNGDHQTLVKVRECLRRLRLAIVTARQTEGNWLPVLELVNEAKVLAP